MRPAHWIYTIPLRLRSLFRRRVVERELDEELRYHIERQVDANLAHGMDLDEARYAALRAMGGLELRKEQCRDTRRVNLADTVAQDLRYAGRVLRRSPAFTVVAVLSLALGIGAATAVFSVVDGVLLARLPVREPERLVNLRERVPPARTVDEFAREEYVRLRDETRVFSGLTTVALFDRSNITLSGAGGGLDPARARVALVSGNYFSTMGVDAAAGRLLTPDDDRVLGAHPVAVISDAYRERRLGSARDVVGRTLTLNGTAFHIVGVAPRGFVGDWVGRPTDVWMPFMMHQRVIVELPQPLVARNDIFLRLVGRLAPGVSIEKARATLQAVDQRIHRDWAETADRETLDAIARRRIELYPAAHGYSPRRESLAQSLEILTWVVAFVLLVACANVASLLLARAATRQREMAVRIAIGAGMARLARQLLTESVVLAAMGGALGLLCAAWGTGVLASALAGGPVDMFWGRSSWLSFDVRLDARALAFTAALCLLTGILFGLAPAFRGARVSLAPALTGRGATSGASSRAFPLGKGLVVAQVALSLVVLIAAGLFLRTLRNLRSQDLGFERNHVLLVWTQPSATGRTPRELRELWRSVQERVSSIPGVVVASASNGALLNGSSPVPGPRVDGVVVPGQDPRPTTLPYWRTFVAPRYFETLGIPLLGGREFTDLDADSTRRRVIVNETFARHYFGDESAVGRLVAFSPDSVVNTEIIGVVRDVVDGTPRAVGQRAMRTYFSYRDRESGRRIAIMMVALRTAGDRHAIAERVREELRAVDPTLPVLQTDTVEERLDDLLAPERLVAGLGAFFGLLAALLACLGLYGVIAYTTTRRTGEIGIRMALGATRGGVLRMVLAECLALVAAGIVTGVPAAMAAGRLIAGRLYGVGAGDPVTIAGVTLLMIGVALVAGFLPARRASRIDPIVALRVE